MAGRNRNRTRQTKPTPTQIQQSDQIAEETDVEQPDSSESTNEVTEEQPMTIENITPNEPPVVISDDVTKKVDQIDPVIQSLSNEGALEIVQSEVLSTTEASGDDEQMVKFKNLLIDTKRALEGRGKVPEDFRTAANLTSKITKFIITQPRQQYLDTLLAFFIENKDGVCHGTEFMKGSTTLSRNDEQQLGFLNSLMNDLANRRISKVNHALITSVMRKPEIAEYFKRKMNGLKAQLQTQ